MAKIPVNGIIQWFQKMYREHWSYVWGAAQDGCVDCSGAFVNVYRKYGQSIYHGSNAIARRYIVELLPISAAKPGMAAFKIRKPNDRGYALPAAYQKGGSSYNGDLNDYYHIGLVDADGKNVLNAQNPDNGFGRSALTKWAFVGYLKAVDYNDPTEKQKEGIPMQSMTVTSKDGNPVKMRQGPGTDKPVIAKLKVGTQVQAGDDVNGWREIVCGDEGGYMMSQFLVPADKQPEPAQEPAPETPSAFVVTLTTEKYNELCDARDKIEAALKTIKSIVGVG